MHTILTFALKPLAFVFIISVIVFIHEFGHYIVAKWAGVKIDVFSIGFGRELFGWHDRSGTRWRVSALPFGGYVKMYGDASEASTPLESIDVLSDEEKGKTFYYKPLYKKALIVAAGPFFNFILTTAILTGFIYTNGMPSTEPVIGEVKKDSAAVAAGLKEGDRILSINGNKVVFFQDIPNLIITNLGTPITLGVQRQTREFNVTLTPRMVEEDDGHGNKYTRPLIGILTHKVTFDKVNPIEAVGIAAKETYYRCAITIYALGQMISGERSAREISGPIGMAQISGQAVEKGWLFVFLTMANISANLGLINLFPIPMLDGGHLLYYAIEAIQGRPLAKRFQEYGFRIGMALIAMLMAFAVFNDIRKLLVSLVGM